MAEYAEWLMEAKREQRGLLPDDKLQDEDIIKELKSGEKLSKSKHLNQKENHMTDKQIRDEAMRQVMWKCGITANDVTRYIADAVAEKVVRDEDGDGWIPVSERLPEDGIYLVTCDDEEYPVKRMRMRLRHKTGIPIWLISCGIYDGRVLAWMPLPEPYKAE